MFVRRLLDPTGTSSRAQIHQAATILAEAFIEDPSFVAVFNRSLPVLYINFRSVIITGLLDAEVWVSGRDTLDEQEAAEDGDGDGQSTNGGERIEGVIVVYPSGKLFGSTANSQGPHFQLVQEKLSEETKVYRRDVVFANLHRLMSETYGPTAERDLVYISHLAVSPSAQGLGLGRAMVSMVLDRAREQGEDVILFTALERTKIYYESMGFETGGQVDIDFRGNPGTFWALRRRASTDVGNKGL